MSCHIRVFDRGVGNPSARGSLCAKAHSGPCADASWVLSTQDRDKSGHSWSGVRPFISEGDSENHLTRLSSGLPFLAVFPPFHVLPIWPEACNGRWHERTKGPGRTTRGDPGYPNRRQERHVPVRTRWLAGPAQARPAVRSKRQRLGRNCLRDGADGRSMNGSGHSQSVDRLACDGFQRFQHRIDVTLARQRVDDARAEDKAPV
jgi:hypothetical protein